MMNYRSNTKELSTIPDIDSIDVDSYVQHIIDKNGPDEEEFLELYGLLVQVKAEDIPHIRELIAPILNINTLIGFSFTKPFGYSGDFFIIEKLYQYYINPDERYGKWDAFLLSSEAVTAVRNRKTLAIEIFEKLNENAFGVRQDVMILGSGPVTETYEFFERNPDSPLIFEMLDMDSRAISYAKNKNRKYLNSMTFHNVNVVRYNPEKKYDLIWSAGLFDYFKNKHFVFLIKKYYQYLNDDGEMIIGNFNIENPSRKSMEILCDWFLYHRSADELIQFAIQAGIEKSKIDVIQEPSGVNLFLRVKK